MSVTLEEVKQYLRIDGEAEDALLTRLMTVAEAYLEGAVGGYRAIYEVDADFAAKADWTKLVLVGEYYQNRANDPRGDYSYAVRTLISQLQWWTRGRGEFRAMMEAANENDGGGN